MRNTKSSMMARKTMVIIEMTASMSTLSSVSRRGVAGRCSVRLPHSRVKASIVYIHCYRYSNGDIEKGGFENPRGC